MSILKSKQQIDGWLMENLFRRRRRTRGWIPLHPTTTITTTIATLPDDELPSLEHRVGDSSPTPPSISLGRGF